MVDMTSPLTETRMTPEQFAELGGPNLVYVKPIRAAEIMAETPQTVIEGLKLTPEQVLYAVCRADGARLAILGDRDSAVAAALAHELAPVSVH
jgi:hypothetical protein